MTLAELHAACCALVPASATVYARHEAWRSADGCTEYGFAVWSPHVGGGHIVSASAAVALALFRARVVAMRPGLTSCSATVDLERSVA